ncbi:MAG: hypothetical protein RQ741_12870 [Wenzhouxiangellaceae bacterium]|nr:hypothetical protein [Wenzhouxiangellaceae bacterium]
MIRLLSAIFLVAVCLTAYSCLSDDQTIPVDLAGMGETVIPKLEARDIWYRQAGAGMIEVKIADMEQVAEILEALLEALLPVDRSGSFNAKVQPILKQRLGQQGISYETGCFDELEFLIWESGKSQEVQAITEDVFETLVEQDAFENEPNASQAAACL